MQIPIDVSEILEDVLVVPHKTMNHRFILNLEIPDGATLYETGRPLTRDQIEAIACEQLRDELIMTCTRSTMPRGSIGIVTERAPAREGTAQ